ncbi:MAG: hypothetical protein AB1714_22870 [Acidobacteriota bacterium]
MRFRDHSVSQVRVGLHSIGVAGLGDALRRAAQSGLQDREAIIDLIMEDLAARNYTPENLAEDYRTAVWREYLRSKGEDFSEYYSAVPVTIRGEPGEDRDRFVSLVEAVLARFELRPVFSFAPAGPDGPNPQLAIGEETIARGLHTRLSLETAVRNSLSGW